MKNQGEFARIEHRVTSEFNGGFAIMEINNKADAPIGVFDSGVGGLTVAREIMRQLPSENKMCIRDRSRARSGSWKRWTWKIGSLFP